MPTTMCAVGGGACVGISFLALCKFMKDRRDEADQKNLELEAKVARVKAEKIAHYKAEMAKNAESANEKGADSVMQTAMSTFDKVAVDGKIHKSKFVEVMQPLLQSAVKEIPLSLLFVPLNKPELTKGLVPIAEVALQDVTHVLDCTKVADLVFSLVDANGNGYIERDEVRSVVKEVTDLSTKSQGDMVSVFDLCFKLVDRDHSKTWEIDEVFFFFEAVFELAGFALNIALKTCEQVLSCPLVEDEVVKHIPPIPQGGQIAAMKEAWASMCQGVRINEAAEKNCCQGILSHLQGVKTLWEATDASMSASAKVLFAVQGGVDKKRFVSHVAPLIKEQWVKKVEYDPFSKGFMATLDQTQSLPPQAQAMNSMLLAVMKKNWASIKKTQEVFMATADARAANVAEVLFGLADFNEDGIISKDEVAIIHDLLQQAVSFHVPAMLRRGDLTEQQKDDLKQICPAILSDSGDTESIRRDALVGMCSSMLKLMDKNDDGQVTPREIAQCLIHFARSVNEFLKCSAEWAVAATGAITIDLLRSVLKDADIPKHFGKDDVQNPLFGLRIMQSVMMSLQK